MPALFIAQGYFALTDPKVPYPLAASTFFWGFALALACAGVFSILDYYRHLVTIHNESVSVRGPFGTTNLSLKAVTQARWTPLSSVGLRSPTARLSIELSSYNESDRESMIRHLRSTIDPAVQVDWNLFIYKEQKRAARQARTKPGPEEILVHRSYWDRRLLYFGLPFVLAVCAFGVVTWRMTGDFTILEIAFIAGPVATLLGWFTLRLGVPLQGRVDRRISTVVRSSPSLQFSLRVTVVFAIIVALLVVFRQRITDPGLLFMSAAIVSLGSILFVLVRQENVDKRLDRHLADLAAKDRGELHGGLCELE